jgi:soluble lytic murein transglycosylase
MKTLPLTFLGFVALATLAADTTLTELGQGITAYNSRDFSGAVAHLRNARTVNQLSDYVAYHLAYSQLLTSDVDGAITTLNAYRADPIVSTPLAGKLAVLYGRALLDKRDPELASKAVNALQADYKILPQPDGDFAMGLAYEAVNEQQQAVLSYQHVFYSYPNTDLAAQSSTALERLKVSLGKDYPAPSARQQLERCEKWIAAKEYGKARQEYTALADSLADSEKEEALLGAAIVDYVSGNNPEALRQLKALEPGKSELDAKRLYYLTESARKAGDDAAMMEAVKQLGDQYPQSVWRLKALVTAGDRYLVANDRDNYTPLFKAAADSFPADASTAYCHWKITWDAYSGDKPERVSLLREQVSKYPDDSRAATALYYLGRIAELNSNYAEAHAWYDKLSVQYPHYFYGVLAREHLRDKVASATPDPEVATWLASVAWPKHRDFSATEPNAATQQRIARARLLRDAGLPDVAEAEVRFGASTQGEQPHLLAMDMAENADSSFRALRIMKSFSADYLSLPLDQAPVKFWQMLFPLPYKDDLLVNARDRGLDPWEVAGLIRQESEFNPVAKSRANAYGLMQLIPSTGRMLGRQQGMGSVSTSSLLTPTVSIKLGTEYFRQQLASWDGDKFRTLAAYNAGPGRVHQWLSGSNYREPAEFVESIPFSETREYVQAVLRNADIYRELYAGKSLPEVHLTGIPKPPVKMASLVTAGAGRTSAPKPSVTKRVLASSRTPAASSAKKPASTSKAAPSKRTAASKTVAQRSPVKKRDPA